MREILEGYSRALYASWLWHKPLQLLIDAGEGLHLALGTQVLSPDVVAISHGHSDHVLGLPGFAAARRFGKGAPLKPWTLLYPAGSRGVEALRTTIGELWQGVTFPITWIGLAPGGTFALSSTRTLEAFAVTHVPPEPALGFRVLEKRRRRKAGFDGLSSADLERLSRTYGRDHVMESFQHVVFAHSGDAMPIDPSLVMGADLLVHDATFLASAERREPIHASSEEVFDVARTADVRALVLNHLSVRYDRAAALPRLRGQLAASGFRGDAWLLDEARFIPLR